MVGSDAAVREKLLTFYNESSIGGHSGISATLKRLNQDFYWKRMKQDVYAFVKECDTC